MLFPLLQIQFKKLKADVFIKFWSSHILLTENDKLYTDRIDKKEFTRNDIDKFYDWKNGMKINTHVQKNISINKIKRRLTVINELKKNFNADIFNFEFKDISAIWQIFLLHLIGPKTYPIFDQHVFRAHQFLLNKRVQEISKSKKEILNYYYTVYIPFFRQLRKSVKDPRKVDLALVALGQFLKTRYSQVLLNR
jgi:hypothetical protein